MRSVGSKHFTTHKPTRHGLLDDVNEHALRNVRLAATKRRYCADRHA
jgi:hypothetical protein